jgi:imidazolonepropionase-like amidohydrolase
LGTLERGKLADLIVVDGSPLDDLSALDSVLYVVKDGEVVVSPQQEGK